MTSQRSYKPELLDDPHVPFEAIRQNMQELNFINTWLGGHKITLDGFKQLAKDKRQISVCEIGCGGGDNLLAIDSYCKKKNIAVTLIGIDIKPECIAFAEGRNKFSAPVNWICSDYQSVEFVTKPDIIFSSLFCHHFSEDELVFQVKWMKQNSSVGFFINDLQRHPLAYHAIRILTRLFSNSYLVKNDAPLSVLRGFKKHELIKILQDGALSTFDIFWKWAFRFLVIYRHG